MSNLPNQNHWIETLVESCLNKLPPIYIALLIFGLTFLGLRQRPSPACTHVPTQNQPINTRAEFQRLKLNMTLAEVESILGRGNEVQQSPTDTTFIWENIDCSSITVVFKNGKLESKNQSNLQ